MDGNAEVVTSADELGIDDFPREEVLAIIRDIFRAHDALSRDDTLRAIFDSLREEGLSTRRLSKPIGQSLESHLAAAVRRDVIYRDRGNYRIDCRSIDEYKRDDLVKYLTAAVGRTWHTRDEAIKAAARHIGFRRTGRNIQAAFKSAINAGIHRNLLDRDGPDYIRRT